MSYVRQIAEHLGLAKGPAGFPEFFVAVLREIAQGRPVSRAVLASSLGWSVTRLSALLEHACSTEYDEDGNIVGYGLTLRETTHAFEIDGRRLYTWCAFDTLLFPGLLGTTAHVVSRCPATGTPILLTVAPDEVRFLQPADAVVSLVLAGASPDIRRSFCCQVHFFASADAAHKWGSKHPSVRTVSVADAFRSARELSAQLVQRAPACANSLSS